MPTDRPLYRWEAIALAALVPLVIGFGVLTLFRAAYDPENRKTDFGVYARAAHSVRVGADLYSTADDNGWHYVYPPPFVLLFLPLADPPAGADRSGYMPYPVGIVVWYAINLALLAWSLHTFAKTALPEARRYSARWWYARTMPFNIGIASVGFTLSRGQANLLVVALIAAMYSATMRNRRFLSGVWLAGACCLKIFPGMLFLFAFARRDWRCVVGAGVASMVFLAVVPSFAFGVEGMLRENERFLKFVAAPGFIPQEKFSEDDRALEKALAQELHDVTAKQSQSFMGILHYIRYPAGGPRPTKPDADVKRIHWAISFAMILATVIAVEVAKRRRELSKADWLVALGLSVICMLLIVPMSHMHYYCMMLPALAGLWLKSIHDHPRTVLGGKRNLAVLITWGALNAVPLLPGEFCLMLREWGLATWSTLALWAYSATILVRRLQVVTR